MCGDNRVQRLSMDQSWSTLSPLLNGNVLSAVDSLKFEHMTPVQAACIPQFVQNKDVAVEAVTGSGKTLAFVVPIFQMLCRRESPLRKNEIGAIILTPTRELAFQIDEVVSHFLKFLPQFSSCLFIGGSSPQSDMDKFCAKGGHIVIATPGRLEDLFHRKQTNFNMAAAVKALEVLVLDEADRLLDMGFRNSITEILSYLPKLRRTGLFSATQTDEVDKLIRAGLRNPLQITVKEKPDKAGLNRRTPSTLNNYFMCVNAEEKLAQLVALLRQHKTDKVMVFFSTCACVDYFSTCLKVILKKYQILAIHSKIKAKRNKVFSDFRQMKSGILMCTDVMARGVDIPDVQWVIQFDPPSSASAFVHRCGRTARIGHTGNALVLLLPSEDAYVKFIEINQKVPLSEMSKQSDCPEVSTRLQTLALNDRAVYEKGLRAFVSYIQAYVKHECNMILRLKDLHFGGLAQGFGLLHIPRMPELKGKKLEGFEPIEVDPASIAYQDKVREKMRQEQVANGEEKKKKHRPIKTVAWSKQKEKKEKKERRKEKSAKRGEKRKQPPVEEDMMEEDDLDQDIRLLKKLKRGKISQADFDKKFVGEDMASHREGSDSDTDGDE